MLSRFEVASCASFRHTEVCKKLGVVRLEADSLLEQLDSVHVLVLPAGNEAEQMQSFGKPRLRLQKTIAFTFGRRVSSMPVMVLGASQ